MSTFVVGPGKWQTSGLLCNIAEKEKLAYLQSYLGNTNDSQLS